MKAKSPFYPSRGYTVSSRANWQVIICSVTILLSLNGNTSARDFILKYPSNNPMQCCATSSSCRYALSLHAGSAIPTGNFNTPYDPGMLYMLDAGVKLSSHFILVAYAGLNNFNSAISNIDDNRIVNLSLNLKYCRPIPLLPTSNFYAYAQLGPGIYIPQTGETEYGYNLGVGGGRKIGASLTAEFGADYHRTFNDIQFTAVHVGIIYTF